MASPWRWSVAVLIAAHPHGLPRQRAWSLLWGDDGTQSLRQALVSLRRLRGAADWLEDGELLCVNSTVDAAAFEDAVSQRDYARALELHRGALSEGVQVRTATNFQDWLNVERMRLQELLLEALRGRSAELNDVQPSPALSRTREKERCSSTPFSPLSRHTVSPCEHGFDACKSVLSGEGSGERAVRHALACKARRSRFAQVLYSTCSRLIRS